MFVPVNFILINVNLNTKKREGISFMHHLKNREDFV